MFEGNILLIDMDKTKIGNVALMKISAHYKKLGYLTHLNDIDVRPDKVFISTIFKKNRAKVDQWLNIYPDAEVGGTGWDLQTNLADEIEYIKPDYELYPNIHHGIGFTSRGCIRKCSFCVVAEKEGKMRSVATVHDIYNPKSDKIILLDNNFFANPDWKDRVEEIVQLKLKVDFNGGIDMRIMTDEIAQGIVYANPPYTRFAFDDIKLEKTVKKGIETLRRNGFPINRNRLGAFVLVGYNSTHEEDLYRVNMLHDYNINTHVQCFEGSPRLTRHLNNWANSPRQWRHH